MVNTPDTSNKMLDIEQHRVEAFQCSFTRISGKFCMLLNSDKQYHVREIARLTGTVAGTLHKELTRLAEAGVLVKEAVGNQVHYRANIECSIYEELKSILEKLTEPVSDESIVGQTKMSDMIEKYRSQILLLAKENGVRNVRVFGSMARNEAGPDSDLDLLVDIETGRSGLALGDFLLSPLGRVKTPSFSWQLLA